MTSKRVITQITAASSGVNNERRSSLDKDVLLFALCNDGSTWMMNPDEFDPEWQSLPEIPQHEVTGDL
jgi:hypothetical protein